MKAPFHPTLIRLHIAGICFMLIFSLPVETLAQQRILISVDTLYGSGIDQFTKVYPSGRRQSENRFGPITTDFDISYTGFPIDAETAFQYAADIWAAEIFSTIPIKISASYTPLGLGVLGSASANLVFSGGAGAPVPSAFYPAALRNQFEGCDLSPSEVDINVVINSTTNWYTGTDLNPGAGQYDLVTVVLHELGHGLGFFGTATFDDGSAPHECDGISGNGCIGLSAPSMNYMIFDHYVENGSMAAISSFTNPSGNMGTQLTGNDLFWNGANGIAGNSGSNPKLYAPASFQPGSSYSHLDESTYPAGNANSLMTPSLGTAEAIHDIGNICRGMMQDMGWDVNSNPKAAFSVREVAYTNQTLNFTDKSALASSWAWDFETDGFIDDINANPSHIYTSAGTYTVTLTINGNPALTSTLQVDVFDIPDLPFTLDFESDADGFYPNSGNCDQWERSNGSGKPNYGSQPGGFGSFSWFTNATGSHGANTFYYLETPPLSFAGAIGDYFLDFEYRAALSTNAGFNLQYSIDGGINWNVLGGMQGVDPEAINDWYNVASISGLNSEVGWAPNTAFAFAIFTPNYRINTVKGFSDVRFRFQFGASSISNLDGVQLDNFSISGNALPLEAFPFWAELQDASVQLTWEDPTFEEGVEYIIEKAGPQSDFHSLDTVHAFQYHDLSPIAGKQFYRLLKRFPDGHYGYSEIQSVDFRPIVPFKIYPNPTIDLLHIQLFSDTGAPVYFKLFDLSGKCLYEAAYPSQPLIELNLQGLNPGCYLYQIDQGLQNHQGKILKQ